MTVKCISTADQKNIVNAYLFMEASIDLLAMNAGRSRRTIIRVLEDADVDPHIHRRPGRKSKAVLTQQPEFVFPDYAVYPLPVGDPIRLPKFGWFQRTLDAVVRRLTF